MDCDEPHIESVMKRFDRIQAKEMSQDPLFLFIVGHGYRENEFVSLWELIQLKAPSTSSGFEMLRHRWSGRRNGLKISPGSRRNTAPHFSIISHFTCNPVPESSVSTFQLSPAPSRTSSSDSSGSGCGRASGFDIPLKRNADLNRFRCDLDFEGVEGWSKLLCLQAT
jgi:hypothetical protein